MDAVIKVENLTKRFGSFIAVDNISFEVGRGEIFGFLGANGAGKTTAMRMLCGLLSPTSGKGTVAGYDIYRQTNRIKRSIGYMSQKFSLYNDLTIKENMRLFGGIYGMSNGEIKAGTETALEKSSLNGNILVKSLPPGIKQKAAFAVSIFHSPKIVFLDEPTGGVDPLARRMFWETISETARQGVTVFVTTHYMDEAEYCDRVSIMVDGRVEALDSPENLREKFDVADMNEVFHALARNAKRIDI